MNCPYCHKSKRVQRRGKRRGSIRYFCFGCLKWFSIADFSFRSDDKNARPKILLFDIETLPLEVVTFGIRDQYISHENILRDACIVSWAAKWLRSDKIISEVLSPENALEKNDFSIVKSLWSLLDEADIVVTHNGDNFDIPLFRARLLKHGIPNPRYFKSVDTYKIARNQFRLVSNRLDYLLTYLGFEGKIDTDLSLWTRCLRGDLNALQEMDRYCRADVQKLEEVYMALLPYIPNHPNIGLWSSNTCCPNCGCSEYDLAGDYAGTTYLYDAYRCKKCGSLWRSRKRKKLG